MRLARVASLACVGTLVMLTGCVVVPLGGRPYPAVNQADYPYPTQYADGYAYGNSVPTASPYDVRYGWVESIQLVPVQRGTSGVGGVVGGVVGGLLGHQIGGGRGNTAATIGGAVVGAVAGNEIERQSYAGGSAYQVNVRLNDNTMLSTTQLNAYNMRIGDRVRVENGMAVPY